MHPEKLDRLRRLQARAKMMRNSPTESEAAFWNMVRKRRFRGHRFRRQVVMDPYIIDFYCRSLQLAVEIDGPVHASCRAPDVHRDATLNHRKIYVFRFDHDEIMHEPNKVWKMLLAWHDGTQS